MKAQHVRRQFTEDEIERMAATDAEIPPLTDEQLGRAVAVSASGRRKRPISIRLDEETLAAFQAEGAGYQTRINDVLSAERAGHFIVVPREWAAFFGRDRVRPEVLRLVNDHICRETKRKSAAA